MKFVDDPHSMLNGLWESAERVFEYLGNLPSLEHHEYVDVVESFRKDRDEGDGRLRIRLGDDDLYYLEAAIQQSLFRGDFALTAELSTMRHTAIIVKGTPSSHHPDTISRWVAMCEDFDAEEQSRRERWL